MGRIHWWGQGLGADLTTEWLHEKPCVQRWNCSVFWLLRCSHKSLRVFKIHRTVQQKKKWFFFLPNAKFKQKYIPLVFLYLLSFSSFGVTGAWTQGLTLARQALHQSHIYYLNLSPFYPKCLCYSSLCEAIALIFFFIESWTYQFVGYFSTWVM
jgi:hypothetical protein